MNYVIVECGPAGRKLSDFKVEEAYQEIRRFLSRPAGGETRQLAFATAPIFTRIQIGVCQGEISPEQPVFVIEGQTIGISPAGYLDSPPDGFADLEFQLDQRLLAAQRAWSDTRRAGAQDTSSNAIARCDHEQ